jgi:hypothetical protein
VKSHLSPNTPDIRDRALLEHPVTLGLVTKIDYATALCLPFLGRIIGQLAECFRTSDANPDRDTGGLINLCSDLSSKRVEITRYPCSSGLGLSKATRGVAAGKAE